MMIALKNLGKISTGNTPSKKYQEYYDSNDIGFVKPDNISDTFVTDIKKTTSFISQNARNKARIATKGSVLVTCIGSIGKIGIVTEGEVAFNQQINTILPNENVNQRYLAYNLLYNKPRLIDIANAPVVPIINKSQFENFEINFDSNINNQTAIVKQLNCIECIIRHKQNLAYKLDELVKARFVEMFGAPRNNIFGYIRLPLKDSCKLITGNTPSRNVAEYYGNYIEWIKTDNIVSGLLNPTKADEYLSKDGMKIGRIVEKDSILMACIAGSIASIGKVCVTDRAVAFNQQINAIVPAKYNVLFLYAMLQLSKDYLVEEINMSLKGILSKSKLAEKEFIVPPMELQNQFADFVKQANKSKVVIEKSLKELETLQASLMQEYFS